MSGIQGRIKKSIKRKANAGFVPFLNMPCIKKVYRNKTGLLHSSAARNEERSHRWSTGYRVFLPVLIKFLVGAFENTIRTGVRRGIRGIFVSWENRSVGSLSCPAPPRPAAPLVLPHSDAPVVFSGLGFDKSSIKADFQLSSNFRTCLA